MATRHGFKRSGISENKRDIEADARDVAAYLSLKDVLLTNKKSQVWTIDMLHKTTEMLLLNLEFYTIWNYRRQILQFLISNEESESSAQSFLYDDLKFTMECLLKHPKSYWVWNHRSWCLEKLTEKDWVPELGLVSKMLDLDIRNFHGWDYRRTVVSRVPSQTQVMEWAYSTQKIHQNFSNYSAWHYRSKLLEKAFPDPEKQLETREKELAMVEAAYYTEPNDQAPWFYLRFLLGWERESIRPLRATFSSRNSISFFAIYFNAPVKMACMPYLIAENGTRTNLRLEHESHYSPNQIFRVPSSPHIRGALHFPFSCAASAFDEMLECNVKIELDELRSQVAWDLPRTDCSICMPKDAWERQRQSITALLSEETDCKWALLMLIHIWRHLGGFTKEILDGYGKLVAIDPYRREYYKEEINRERLRARLLACRAETDELDLSSLDLKHIHPSDLVFLQTHFSRVNLSCNDLCSLESVGCVAFFSTHIIADHNDLESLDSLPFLPFLEHISVQGNQLSDECFKSFGDNPRLSSNALKAFTQANPHLTVSK